MNKNLVELEDATFELSQSTMQERPAIGRKKHLNLSVADPDLQTPSVVSRALIRAVRNGRTHYSNPRGLPEFLDSVADYFARTQRANLEPDREILSTVGSGEGVFLAIAGVVSNAGQEVIVPDPSFHGFKPRIEYFKAKTVFVGMDEENNHHLKIEKLQGKINSRTAAICICNPNNPTGTVYGKREIQKVLEIAHDHHIYAIFDENYAELVYDGRSFTSAASFISDNEHAIVVSGLSKTLGMSGFRLGYVIARAKIIDQLSKLGFEIHGAVATPVQVAGAAAMDNAEKIGAKARKIYEPRRDLVLSLLRKETRLECSNIESGVTAFPTTPVELKSSVLFSSYLLKTMNLVVNPGIEFGVHGEGHFRLSFGVPVQSIRDGISRICVALDRLRK